MFDLKVSDDAIASFPVFSDDVHLNGMTAKPVTNSQQLIDAGKEMINALGWWVDRCIAGYSLIYLIYLDGWPEIEAAMEAVKKEGQWTLQQVKGVRNTKALPPQVAIAEHVIQVLNSDEKSREEVA